MQNLRLTDDLHPEYINNFCKLISKRRELTRKMYKRPEKILHERGYPNGQKAHEVVFSFISHQINTN